MSQLLDWLKGFFRGPLAAYNFAALIFGLMAIFVGQNPDPRINIYTPVVGLVWLYVSWKSKNRAMVLVWAVYASAWLYRLLERLSWI